jgi:hypothetical protein
MKFFTLVLLTFSLANYALEHSGSSQSSSTSPRLKESPRTELQIDGKITCARTFSKDKTRLKCETLLAAFKGGHQMEISCIFKKNKPSKYAGNVIKNQEKIKVNPISAEQDFSKLKALFIQQNSDTF